MGKVPLHLAGGLSNSKALSEAWPSLEFPGPLPSREYVARSRRFHQPEQVG